MHGLMYSMRSTITVVGDAFLLLREGDHRALDSFPTRRSSDLATCARRWLAERPAGQQADDGTEEHDAEEVFHFQFRISGRSWPLSAMYCLCSMSLSRMTFLACHPAIHQFRRLLMRGYQSRAKSMKPRSMS